MSVTTIDAQTTSVLTRLARSSARLCLRAPSARTSRFRRRRGRRTVVILIAIKLRPFGATLKLLSAVCCGALVPAAETHDDGHEVAPRRRISREMSMRLVND